MASGRRLLTAALVAAGLIAAGPADAQRRAETPRRVGGEAPAVTVNENVLRGLGRQQSVPGLIRDDRRQQRGRLRMPNAENGPASSGAQFHLEDPGAGMPRGGRRHERTAQPARRPASPALDRNQEPTPRASPTRRLDRPGAKPQPPTGMTGMTGDGAGGDPPRTKPRQLADRGGDGAAKAEATRDTAPEQSATDGADEKASQPAPDAAAGKAPQQAEAPKAPDTTAETAKASPQPADSAGESAPEQAPAPQQDAPEAPETGASGPPAAPDVQTARRPEAEDRTAGGDVKDTGGDGPGARILFPAGSAVLPDEAQARLDELVTWLKDNPDRRLKLRAFADSDDGSESQARRLSLSRALAVRSQLIDAGLRSTRIDVRALGDATESGNPNRVDLSVAE